jgi:hypothetical protein
VDISEDGVKGNTNTDNTDWVAVLFFKDFADAVDGFGDVEGGTSLP